MANITLTGVKEAVKEYNDWTHGYAEIWLDCETGEVHASVLVGYGSYITRADEEACTIIRKCSIWDEQRTNIGEVEKRCKETLASQKAKNATE